MSDAIKQDTPGTVAPAFDNAAKLTQTKVPALDNTKPRTFPVFGNAAKAVSKRQAGEMLSVSQTTIGRLIDNGELPAFQVGCQWRIWVADLHAYVALQQQKQQRRTGKIA